MDANTYGGTPPKLWDMKKVRTLAWSGLVRDQVRIKRLCRQVEKLSWMLETMDNDSTYDLEGAECEWQYERANLN